MSIATYGMKTRSIGVCFVQYEWHQCQKIEMCKLSIVYSKRKTICSSPFDVIKRVSHEVISMPYSAQGYFVIIINIDN